MPDVRLEPIFRPFSATFSPPGSKSITNRALVLSALAGGVSTLTNILVADDTRVMIDGLRKLGFELDLNEAEKTVRVVGQGGKIPADSAEIFCGNSGTTIRFLTALCGLGHGRYILDGVDRMRQRPIGELVDLLRNFAVPVKYLGETGYPPIEIQASGLAGGIQRFGAAQSSQYLSAVLMASPFARHEAEVDLIGKQTSWPYVGITMRMMDFFGVTPEVIYDPKTGEPIRIHIERGAYHPLDYAIEPDASNASYFLAAAAIHPGSRVTINGLGKRSLQGDVGFADVLHRMGANLIFGADFMTIAGPPRLQGIDVDLSPMPDTAQTLAVTALFAEGPTAIRGLHTLRVKETDRLAALSAELTRLGADVDIDSDTLHIDPPTSLKPAAVDTYDDHRMAMSFALAATEAPGIVIRDAQCVNKTYPGFFEDLRGILGQKASTVEPTAPSP